MNIKKILITLAIITVCSSTASARLESEFSLSKVTNTDMFIIPGNSCFEECNATYERCIDQIGDRPGGSFYCSYQNLMCIDECEFGEG